MTRIQTFRTLIPALLIAFLFAACSDQAAESPAEATSGPTVRTVRVETIQISPQPFEEIIALIGIVQSPNDARLSSQSMGTLIARQPLGTRIKKGDIIARTDATLIEAILIQAKSSLEAFEADADFAEDTFNRQEPLYRDSIISALEFEQLRTKLNASRAQLARARAMVAQSEKELENTLIVAPFNGTIEEHYAEIGEHVSIGTPVVRLVDTSTLKISAGVPEKYVRDISVNSAITLRFKAYGFEEREATISFVGSVIDPQNRSFLIEVMIDNSAGDLKPAMIADLFLTRKQLENQTVIPQTSILRDELGNSVYVVNRSSGTAVAERKSVYLGASYDGQTVVTSGLEIGDEVIVVGHTRITDGDAVESVGSLDAPQAVESDTQALSVR